MKAIKIMLLSVVLLTSSVFFISCSVKDKESTTITSASDHGSDTQTFTLEDLKKYDGQNGNPAYVAVDGIVYDVTNADGWKDGKHKDGITAGVDLTSKLADSPHGEKVLKDLPVVGKLK